MDTYRATRLFFLSACVLMGTSISVGDVHECLQSCVNDGSCPHLDKVSTTFLNLDADCQSCLLYECDGNKDRICLVNSRSRCASCSDVNAEDRNQFEVCENCIEQCFSPDSATMKPATTEMETDVTTDMTTVFTTDMTTDFTTDMTTVSTTDMTTDFTTDMTTVFTTDMTTVFTTDMTTDFTTDMTTDVTTDMTTESTTDMTTESTTDMTTESTIDITTGIATDMSTAASIEIKSSATTQETTVGDNITGTTFEQESTTTLKTSTAIRLEKSTPKSTTVIVSSTASPYHIATTHQQEAVVPIVTSSENSNTTNTNVIYMTTNVTTQIPSKFDSPSTIVSIEKPSTTSSTAEYYTGTNILITTQESLAESSEETTTNMDDERPVAKTYSPTTVSNAVMTTQDLDSRSTSQPHTTVIPTTTLDSHSTTGAVKMTRSPFSTKISIAQTPTPPDSTGIPNAPAVEKSTVKCTDKQPSTMTYVTTDNEYVSSSTHYIPTKKTTTQPQGRTSTFYTELTTKGTTPQYIGRFTTQRPKTTTKYFTRTSTVEPESSKQTTELPFSRFTRPDRQTRFPFRWWFQRTTTPPPTTTTKPSKIVGECVDNCIEHNKSFITRTCRICVRSTCGSTLTSKCACEAIKICRKCNVFIDGIVCKHCRRRCSNVGFFRLFSRREE
uniref:mucin-2-like n=1 Tax=Styela clava TaxID=7725 RepID=UPI001939821E|nr:mucin-2-like [Styela clava]